MFKFLLDANLSPTTANYLRDLDFDVKSITEEKVGCLLDENVGELKKNTRSLIVIKRNRIRFVQ